MQSLWVTCTQIQKRSAEWSWVVTSSFKLACHSLVLYVLIPLPTSVSPKVFRMLGLFSELTLLYLSKTSYLFCLFFTSLMDCKHPASFFYHKGRKQVIVVLNPEEDGCPHYCLLIWGFILVCVLVWEVCVGGDGWAQRSMSGDLLGYSHFIFFGSGFHVNQDSLEFIR